MLAHHNKVNHIVGPGGHVLHRAWPYIPYGFLGLDRKGCSVEAENMAVSRTWNLLKADAEWQSDGDHILKLRAPQFDRIDVARHERVLTSSTQLMEKGATIE